MVFHGGGFPTVENFSTECQRDHTGGHGGGGSDAAAAIGFLEEARADERSDYNADFPRRRALGRKSVRGTGPLLAADQASPCRSR
jgi:hypothetical protein